MKVGLFIGIFGLLLLVICGVIRIVNDIQFERACGGYMERAAVSNTITVAYPEMEKVVNYIKDLPDGYTSVIYRTPDEDVGFWKNNLTSAFEDLAKAKNNQNLSQLEESNVLLKLHQTLRRESSGDSSGHLICPDGIIVYPSNVGLAIFSGVGLVLLALGAIAFFSSDYGW